MSQIPTVGDLVRWETDSSFIRSGVWMNSSSVICIAYDTLISNTESILMTVVSIDGLNKVLGYAIRVGFLVPGKGILYKDLDSQFKENFGIFVKVEL